MIHIITYKEIEHLIDDVMFSKYSVSMLSKINECVRHDTVSKVNDGCTQRIQNATAVITNAVGDLEQTLNVDKIGIW